MSFQIAIDNATHHVVAVGPFLETDFGNNYEVIQVDNDSLFEACLKVRAIFNPLNLEVSEGD